MSLAIEPGGESIEVSRQNKPETTVEGTPVSRFATADEPAVSSAGDTLIVAAKEKIPPRHGLLQAGQSMLNILVIALFILTFTVQPFRIPSSSMEPTLLVGDFLLVNKQVGQEVAPHIFPPANVIHRGDVIVFHYPVDASLHLVKRVIGLPGDRIRLRDEQVYVNGSALREPYAVYRPSVPDSYRDEFPHMASADPGVDSRWWIQMRSLVSQGELTVPADSYFVLGDNRNDSEDSRYWGFVPRNAIVGKPILVYFSLNEPNLMPSQPSAAALAGGEAVRHASRTNSVANFARWDRALHIIY